MNIELQVPQDWIKIEENLYKQIGIINNDEIKCVGAYGVNDEGLLSVVSFYDYSKHDMKLVYELDRQLKELDEVSKILDETNNDLGEENVVSIRNIYHDFADTQNGKIYVNINKVQNGKEYSYSFQVFAETKQGLMCAQCNLRKLDEKNALASSMQVPYIEKLFDILYQLV